MTTADKFVLVRGVVYKELRSIRRSGIEYKWHRRSVPPDTQPGKRSKWPPTYLPHRLPEHEVIDSERARQVIDASLDRLRALMRETR